MGKEFLAYEFGEKVMSKREDLMHSEGEYTITFIHENRTVDFQVQNMIAPMSTSAVEKGDEFEEDKLQKIKLFCHSPRR